MSAEPHDQHQPTPPPPERPQHPTLRSTIIRPAHQPDPIDSAFVAGRLTTLTHDMANLLDGSLRTVTLARRALNDPEQETRTRRTIDSAALEQLARQLDTVHAAMTCMAEMVRASMRVMSGGDRAGHSAQHASLLFGAGSPFSAAAQHAADVMRPLACDHRIDIQTDVSPELERIAGGPIYSIIVNSVRNAIESIANLGDQGGRVLIRAWVELSKAEHGKGVRSVVLEIIDDGSGPPRFGKDQAESVFRFGYSSKPRGTGVGLAVCLDLVHQLNGTIQLLGLPTDPHTQRGGAVLRVCYPVSPAMELHTHTTGYGQEPRAAG